MSYRDGFESRFNSNRGQSRNRGRGRADNRGRGDFRPHRRGGVRGAFSGSGFSSQSATNNNQFHNQYDLQSDFNDKESSVMSGSKPLRGNNNNHRNQITPDNAGYLQRKPLTYYETENLLNKMIEENFKDNIPLKLLDSEVRFVNFLNNEKTMNPVITKTILKAIIKANANKMTEKNFRELLTNVLRTQFATKRLDKCISIELNECFDGDMLQLIITFFKLNFEIIPGIAYDVFYNRICNLKYIIESFQLRTNYITSEILTDFEELKEMAEASKIPHSTKTTLKIKNVFDDIEPPDNYRNITIFPTSQDLIDIKSKEVFLRKNKSAGTYRSVDDYLDVQFRLMREDFIQPLREGLNSYKNNEKRKHSEIRVYNKVYMINSLPAERLGIIHNLQFDKSRLKKVNWMQSKRFLYGSLLCLSSDNFKTLLFATIVNREIRDLENGILSVKFHNSKPSKDEEYTLIETTNMFESYKHVLLKLQDINEENLSMKKYLVYGDNKIDLPRYLNNNKDFEYQFKSKNIWPGNNDKPWPRGIELDFDESQFQAFQSALTKELTIIQGPPGTGKTYVGLSICECLIKNVQTKIIGFGPILIVCYTNHALDQFLEGILNFTDKIVRIGNRSKSEKLQPFSIFNWKKKCQTKEFGRLKWNIFGKLRELKDILMSKQAGLKASREYLISMDKLKVFINEEQFSYLKMIGLKNWLYGDSFNNNICIYDSTFDTILEWLMYEEIIHNVHQIVIDAQTELLNDIDNISVEDQDNEVTYINDQRKLDIDDEDIANVNEEFNRVLLSYQNNEPLIQDNDGFSLVRNKTTKRLFQSRLQKDETMSPERANQIEHLDLLTIKDRWSLYRYWRSVYTESLQRASTEIEIEYEHLITQVNEIYFEEDRSIMKDQNIIGMTTTGAARYSKVLSEIGCKIIIVEEAAEVLESHIISSLNLGCQHLILIGDHKQLKPNPTVFELAKKYELDLSLFERLINNKLHYNTLLLQHRMRPEIAEIMQFIYKNLQNHSSVLNYPNVPSVSKNLYFLDHCEEEKCTQDIMSYSNPFEAEFIIKFCRHLMKNGVERTQMTILTLYSGQMFLLRQLMDRKIFEGVRVCVVDNYQGEENDIILLSLVRSNEHQRIGFLSIENRICVSLSRAKHGLYVFGNFQILSNQNEKWKEICHYLRRRDYLSNNLTLLCQNHPEKKLVVAKPVDFDNYPEGGCEELCNQRLGCGHACRKACHFLDKNHENNKCMERCTRLCPNKHRCNLKCWQTCKTCYNKIEKVIPSCNHLQLLPCSKDPDANDCTNKCERRIQCGHTCLRLCKDKCDPCLTEVDKVSPYCKHPGIYKCSDLNIICTKPCNFTLGCDHKCEGTCGKCFKGRLHETCNNRCTSQLICGHACTAKCSFYCPPCSRRCEEGCIDNVCPKLCSEECISCFEKCRWRCKHQRCNKLCYEICDRNVCNESCDKLLDCQKCEKRFKCYGICGEPCRPICLNCDPEIKEIFFGTEGEIDCKYITLWTCSHSFEVNSMDNYMNLVPENGEIVAKKCPKCNSIINKRSCFRYLNIVKRIAANIKEVQRRIIDSLETVKLEDYLKKLESRSTKISRIFKFYKIENYFDCNEKILNFKILSFNTSLDLIYQLYQRCFSKDRIIDSAYISTSLSQLITWLNPNKRKFNEFEINQFNAEYDRINMLLKIKEEYRRNPLEELTNFIVELKNITFAGDTAVDFKRRWDEFHRLKMYLPNMEITEDQRKEIVKAVGLDKGRWFKCSQGHFYVIGECGGATQTSKCPECQSSIGGFNHQLLPDNHFAPEMDHSEQPAFPGMRNN